jgi:transposase
LERLQVGDILDKLVPWEGEVPLGTLAEVLIINRLLEPKAMFRLDCWAQNSGVAEYYGLSPGELNDDRLGRALERLAAHEDAAQAALVLKAVRTFGVNVSQIHYDITGVELFGAYEQDLAEGQLPPTPLPTYGHTKSGRKDVKQVQLGLNVSGDGGVPLLHRCLDGNAPEITTHVQNLRRLRGVLGRRNLLYMGDTKLDTPENLLEVRAGQGHFVCGGAFSPELKELYLANHHRLRPVDYCPASQAKRPEDQRDHYQAFELPQRLEGKVQGRTVRLNYRALFIHSQAKAQQQAATRERHLGKLQTELQAAQKNLNRFGWKGQKQIVTRLERLKGRYAEGKLIVYELTEARKGQFQLQWHLDQPALQRVKLLEGVYVLKTDLSKRQWKVAKVLGQYRGQSKVERRFHHLKGPLAVAPMFLKNPQRIAGLMCVLVWALMVMALMERQVRRKLKGQPLQGLYPENRPAPAPTGPALLDCFATLCVVIIKHRGETSRRLGDCSDIQRKLLRLLNIPPDGLRTFKRRCGM